MCTRGSPLALSGQCIAFDAYSPANKTGGAVVTNALLLLKFMMDFA
jgi:hypothetical protein